MLTERPPSGSTRGILVSLLFGFVAVAISALTDRPSFTLTEITLFVGGVIVGAKVRSTIWLPWLACASPLLVYFIRDMLKANSQTTLVLLGLFLFAAASSAAMTSFFALGFAAGRRAWRPPHPVWGLILDVALPTCLGLLVAIGSFTVDRLFGGKRPIDVLFPFGAIVVLCIVFGALAGFRGRLESALARAAALDAGVVIGVTAWWSHPHLGTNAPPLLAAFAVITSLLTVLPTGFGLLWRRRRNHTGPSSV